MPRKLFRRLLPSHESIRDNRYIARLGPRLQHHNLWHLHRRSVAGGLAAGLFAGLVPGSNPVQFTVAALLAVGARVNLPIAVLTTLYSNPFTIVPLYYCAFKLGELAMFRDSGAVPDFPAHLQGKSLTEWLSGALHWLADAGMPLLVGIPLLAILLSVVGYCVADMAWRLQVRCAWSSRRRRRLNSAK